ncbi:hypothetical protein [Magnetospirillum molischianum]|uniref:hypothetical protein n=1 Tax=Magnetospirillum molischianum TaxID=1083 RepID=UPI0002E9B719|nr:hypothetical protein [Magnetospirillum molischianum]
MSDLVHKIVKRPEGFLLTINGTMPLGLAGEPNLYWSKLADLVAAIKKKGFEVQKDGTCVPAHRIQKKGKKT